ncbi:hypothetical protein D3C80_1852300 [compost metagenome]
MADAALHPRGPAGRSILAYGHRLAAQAVGAQRLTGRQTTRQKLPLTLAHRPLQGRGQQDAVRREAGRGEGGGIEADPVDGQWLQPRQ